MHAVMRAVGDAPGARISWCGSLRYFTTSTAHSGRGSKEPKSKHNKTPSDAKPSVPDMQQNICLPPGIGALNMQRIDYPAFVKKLEKLNPGIELTRQQVDWALEQTISKSVPKYKREALESKLRDSTCRRTDSGTVQAIKKLQSASKDYWARRDETEAKKNDEGKQS